MSPFNLHKSTWLIDLANPVDAELFKVVLPSVSPALLNHVPQTNRADITYRSRILDGPLSPLQFTDLGHLDKTLFGLPLILARVDEVIE